MHKLACSFLLEELSYSGCLHVKHVRISPTIKWEVIEFLISTDIITLSENGMISFSNSLFREENQ